LKQNAYLEVSFRLQCLKVYRTSAGAFVSTAIATCTYGEVFVTA